MAFISQRETNFSPIGLCFMIDQGARQIVSGRRLGIVQPGRIGDVIICLPIAKWYADRGYYVIWPVASYIAEQMINYIDYVHFIPISGLDCAISRNILYANCNTVIDLAFSFPNSTPFNDSIYAAQKSLKTFDEIKYDIANVPFSEKWNLTFKRNKVAEEALYDGLVSGVPYTLIHLEGSTQSVECIPSGHQHVVHVKPLSKSLFDWCGIIERADCIVAVDSCLANLVEQSGLNQCSKKLIKRVPDVRPMYQNNWTVVDLNVDADCK